MRVGSCALWRARRAYGSPVTASLSSLRDIVFPPPANLPRGPLPLVKLCSDEEDRVAHVALARPHKGNAFNVAMWTEFASVFASLHPNTRVCVLSGEGKHFSTGMDLSVFAEMDAVLATEKCEGRRREAVARFVQFLQDAVSSTERCAVPVIAAVHGQCVGGAIDLITACDLRYCTDDASFSIKETDLAMVADIGTLQRLPKLISAQRTRELAYTGRAFGGQEAAKMGLVLESFASKELMDAHVLSVAKTIAAKSPLAIRGVKKTLLYARDHSVDDALNQVKVWNAAFLYSEDLAQAMRAVMTKEQPKFK